MFLKHVSYGSVPCPQQVQTHEEHLTYYIIFLRITPFLPNWFINIVCPLIDVGVGPFFVGTFIGMHVMFGVVILSVMEEKLWPGK